METSKAIEAISNDIVGTIVLIVEDEGNFFSRDNRICRTKP